jgi:Ca2+-binding EF-hand superfamily protein
MKVVIKNLNIEQIYDLAEAFTALDTNKTGVIDINDFTSVL